MYEKRASESAMLQPVITLQCRRLFLILCLLQRVAMVVGEHPCVCACIVHVYGLCVYGRDLFAWAFFEISWQRPANRLSSVISIVNTFMSCLDIYSYDWLSNHPSKAPYTKEVRHIIFPSFLTDYLKLYTVGLCQAAKCKHPEQDLTRSSWPLKRLHRPLLIKLVLLSYSPIQSLCQCFPLSVLTSLRINDLSPLYLSLP